MGAYPGTLLLFLYFLHHHPYLILHFYEIIFIFVAVTFAADTYVRMHIIVPILEFLQTLHG